MAGNKVDAAKLVKQLEARSFLCAMLLLIRDSFTDFKPTSDKITLHVNNLRVVDCDKVMHILLYLKK